MTAGEGRGIHHVTLVSSDADRTLAFYGGLLGLRLVKRTVSHQDPGTYHLCLGDDRGRPGTLFTVFPWQRVAKGRRGACEAWRTVFRIPTGSLDWWEKRLRASGLAWRERRDAFEGRHLGFDDPDGAALGLAEGNGTAARDGWEHPDIPGGFALQGLHDLILRVRDPEEIGGLFRDVLGFVDATRSGHCLRLVAHKAVGGTITLQEAKEDLRGRLGAGSIHHVAFRARDAADKDCMAQSLRDRYGIIATASRDRTYFRSVNFRSTCGMLMEIATDGPGFEVDEPYPLLGRRLTLPSILEDRRAELTSVLPSLSPLP